MRVSFLLDAGVGRPACGWPEIWNRETLGAKHVMAVLIFSKGGRMRLKTRVQADVVSLDVCPIFAIPKFEQDGTQYAACALVNRKQPALDVRCAFCEDDAHGRMGTLCLDLKAETLCRMT